MTIRTMMPDMDGSWMSTDVNLFLVVEFDSYCKLVGYCVASSPCCNRIWFLQRRNYMISILTSVNPLPVSGFVTLISARHTYLQ